MLQSVAVRRRSCLCVNTEGSKTLSLDKANGIVAECSNVHARKLPLGLRQYRKDDYDNMYKVYKYCGGVQTQLSLCKYRTKQDY